MRQILLLFLMLSASPATGQGPFPDILPGDPYAASVQRLKDAGILFGYPDGTFRGGQCVTRAELAVVVARMMEYFLQSLPEGVAVRKDTPGLAGRLVRIDALSAAEVLRRSGVQLSPHFLNMSDTHATVEEVSELVYLAVARIIEHVSPPWEGGLEPPSDPDHRR